MTSGGRISQVALCSTDLAATTRLLCEGIGFAQAGSRFLWGDRIAAIQGLPTAERTTGQVSWMVGRQDFVQVELFHHSVPQQRTTDADRLPSDLGWSRWGIATDQFDDTLERLRSFGVGTLTPPVSLGSGRAVCFREPGTGLVVELIERGTAALEPAFESHFRLRPAIAYAAVTVPDLSAARRVFAEGVGMVELAPNALHEPEHERLWGLAGAERETAIFRHGSVLLEVSCYHQPESRPRPEGALLSDQGFMNIAVGFRSAEELNATHERLVSLGARSPVEPPTVPGGYYLTLPGGISLELLWTPREYDGHYGFEPLPLLGRAPLWPRVPQL